MAKLRLFPKFHNLPPEIRLQIWELALSKPQIHFLKLLSAEHCRFHGEQRPCNEYRGHYHVGNDHGCPVFARATFPICQPLNERCCPLENSLSLMQGHTYKTPEPWWYQLRPAQPLSYEQEGVGLACHEARQVSLRKHAASIPVLQQLPDETQRSPINRSCGYGPIFFRHDEPLEHHITSWPVLSLDTASDLVCLQVDSGYSQHRSPLWKQYPEIAHLKQLAVEFHGPTTRDWCASCADRRHPRGEPPRYVVHSRDCEERNRQGSLADRAYGFAPSLRRLAQIVIRHFPAVETIYLLDWGMQLRADHQPGPFALRFSCAEYDFFEVPEHTETWDMDLTTDRRSPFESLDCSKAVERAIPKEWERERTYVSNGVGCLPQRCWDAEKLIQCQVLAAVSRSGKDRKERPHTRSQTRAGRKLLVA